MTPRPPSSTLFPYTTLFRSGRLHRVPAGGGVRRPVNRPGAGEQGAERVPRVGAEAGGPPGRPHPAVRDGVPERDRKSTRLNSSHPSISYAVFCLKKKNKTVH